MCVPVHAGDENLFELYILRASLTLPLFLAPLCQVYGLFLKTFYKFPVRDSTVHSLTFFPFLLHN